jgi:phosphoserine phosphatase
LHLLVYLLELYNIVVLINSDGTITGQKVENIVRRKNKQSAVRNVVKE